MLFSEKIKSFTYFSFVEVIKLVKEMYLSPKAKVPLNIIDSRFMIEKLLKEGFKISRISGKMIIHNYEGLDFVLRLEKSDIKVFRQVILENEYQALVDIIIEKKVIVKTIIDCGANIGLTTLFLKKHFPECSIICVEPDKENADLCEENIEANKLLNVSVLNKGVWFRPAMLKINRNFRDGESWSFSLEETLNSNEADTEAISIEDIIIANCFEYVDILKIDIEGGERYLFKSKEYIQSVLKKVRCLVIEIHDEFNIREQIYACLTECGFSYFDSRELTIAFKD